MGRNIDSEEEKVERMSQKYTSAFTVYDIVGHLHYNVRNIIVLSEEVDGEILSRAFTKAMNRYPYMRKRIVVQDEEYVYIDNPLPPVVYEFKGETLPLGSRDVNYHLLSLDYEGNRIGFNINHTLAGGCGILPWIKTILYTYFCMKYERDFQVPDLNGPDEVPAADERDFPELEDLPEAEGVGLRRIDMTAFFNRQAFLDYFKRGDECQYYYLLEIKQKDMMSFGHLHDGSPSALLSSFMYRTLLSLYPDNEKAIQGFIYQNYRASVGCANSSCDLVRGLYITYPESAKNWDIDMLNTVNRGVVILQSEPENGILEAKTNWERFKGLEACKTLEEKIQYCAATPLFTTRIPASYTVSYTGQIDWGELLPFIKAKHTLVDGNLSLEVAACGDIFDVVLEQLDESDSAIKALTAEFDKEGLAYKLSGPFKKNLPSIRLDQD